MSDITIVRTDEPPLTEPERAVMRRVLRVWQGISDDDNRAWRRFWRKVVGMEEGEIFGLELLFPRHLPTHRGYMKLEGDLFASQEWIADRETFRAWIKVGAGWVQWLPGPAGGVVPIPKSVSFRKADEEDFHRYVRQALEFIRSPHFSRRLWPHLSEADQIEMVDVHIRRYEKFLRRFDE